MLSIPTYLWHYTLRNGLGVISRGFCQRRGTPFGIWQHSWLFYQEQNKEEDRLTPLFFFLQQEALIKPFQSGVYLTLHDECYVNFQLILFNMLWFEVNANNTSFSKSTRGNARASSKRNQLNFIEHFKELSWTNPSDR